MHKLILTAAASLLLTGARVHAGDDTAELVFVGTGTTASSGASQGIYAYRFHPATGETEFLGLAAATPDPTFLALAHDHRTLYAVNEEGSAAGEAGNTVSAFRVDAHNGRLTLLDKVASGGIGPCDLALAHRAHFLLVSNCSSGSVALLPILPDGSLTPAASVVQHHGSSVNPQRQLGPHAHGLAVSLDDRFAFAADLGLDKVLVHPIEPTQPSLAAGSEAASVPPGGGVRHLALDPRGRFLYAIDELDSALSVFRFEHGHLHTVQTLHALPGGAAPQRGGSELAFDPGGHFLYAAVRGDQNNIAVYAVDPHSGLPYPLQFLSTEGNTPRHFALDLTGRWLAVANQNSHSIVWLRRNPQTGLLESAHQHSEQLASPMCIVFVPAA